MQAADQRRRAEREVEPSASHHTLLDLHWQGSLHLDSQQTAHASFSLACVSCAVATTVEGYIVPLPPRGSLPGQ